METSGSWEITGRDEATVDLCEGFFGSEASAAAAEEDGVEEGLMRRVMDIGLGILIFVNPVFCMVWTILVARN